MPRNFGKKLVDGVKEEKNKVKKQKENKKYKKIVCQNCVEFE